MEATNPSRKRLTTWMPLLLLLAALAVPWGIMLHSLSVDWTVNPQYTYGWAVPLLCLYLFGRQFLDNQVSAKKRASEPPGESDPPNRKLFPLGIIGGGTALLASWLITRFIQEANPDWRLVAWAQALEVCGITVLALRILWGCSLRLFPIFFFLVAVPWPTLVELPLIQQLTRMNAAVTVELMGVVDIPALQHGNTIEVGTGFVGIDEACSGIRSFQASLMLALFLGELYRVAWRWRMLLVVAGFGLSFAFNVLRTSLLTFVASNSGIAAVSRWHDPAGVVILVGCFSCLLLLARRAGYAVPRDQRGRDNSAATTPPPDASKLRSMPIQPSLVLLLGIAASEIGVELWYRSHERSLPPRQSWTIERPLGERNFIELGVPERARQMLRFSEGASFRWDDGTVRWQAIFLEWKPGRVTAQLARFHNPEVCLSATGKPHETLLDSRVYEVKSLRLPFRVLRVETGGDTQFLFYCIWEDRAGEQQVVANSIDYRSRVQRAWHGQRNLGQRALEISLQGASGLEEAESLFQNQLHRLLLPNG